MGLSLTVFRRTSHDLSTGYLTFGRYRRLLARDAAGINLDEMAGYGSEEPRPWPDPELQPLVYLLNHSDTEGWLEEWECERLASVMRAFTPPDTWDARDAAYHKALVEMVLDVAENGGAIKFS